jgi:hypothetical protein
MPPRLPGVFTEIEPRHLANPTLAFLKQYWDEKRGGRPMPSRADINPAEMKPHLGWVVLVDVAPDFSDFRYRTIGTSVTRYILADATGKTVREVFSRYGEAALNGNLATYRKCARDRVIVHAYGPAEWMEHDFLDFESLYLPLSDDGETVNMILSAVLFEMAAPLKPDAA